MEGLAEVAFESGFVTWQFWKPKRRDKAEPGFWSSMKTHVKVLSTLLLWGVTAVLIMMLFGDRV